MTLRARSGRGGHNPPLGPDPLTQRLAALPGRAAGGVPGGAARPVGDDGLGEQVAEQVVAALGDADGDLGGGGLVGLGGVAGAGWAAGRVGGGLGQPGSPELVEVEGGQLAGDPCGGGLVAGDQVGLGGHEPVQALAQLVRHQAIAAMACRPGLVAMRLVLLKRSGQLTCSW
jgi:hypothetical protein